jgi:organic radical activating enzyme
MTKDEIYRKAVINTALEIYHNILKRRYSDNDLIKTLYTEKEQLFKSPNILVANRLSVVVTTRCTLKCINCNNLMQHYTEHNDISPEDIISDVDKVLDALDECVCLDIIGGEPFSYKGLDRILEHFLASPKIAQVEMITNGTLLPNKDLLDVLKHQKIHIKISDYGNLEKLFSLIDVLENSHINVEVLSNIKWIKSDLINKDRSTNVLKKQYSKCSSAIYCKTIFNGCMYPCPRAAHLYDLGYAQAKSGNDRMPITDNRSEMRKMLKNFLTMEFTNACNYCDVGTDDPTIVMPAEQFGGQVNRSNFTIVGRKELEELYEWTKQLEEGKLWLEHQYNNYKELYENSTKNNGYSFIKLFRGRRH